MLKEVQPRAQKIAEHRRKYEQKREEPKIRERVERVKKAREEHERAQREEEARRQSGSQFGCFPGGFPGGMPGLNEILSDPEVLAAMQVRLGRTKLNFISLKHFFLNSMWEHIKVTLIAIFY